jgi:hypothetical protein
MVTDVAGTSAVQNRESAKYAIHPPLLTLVRAAHDQDTPAVSPVRQTRVSWGRNCGTANTAAATGSQFNAPPNGGSPSGSAVSSQQDTPIQSEDMCKIIRCKRCV